MGRRQLPRPESAEGTLRKVPPEFVDDGCSSSPDDLFGFDFKWACRIHDWRYCTRCHPPGSMTQGARTLADWELGENIRASLPWRWRWVGWIYRTTVWWHGGRTAWDSCGVPRGTTCRHGMPMPAWMF